MYKIASMLILAFIVLLTAACNPKEPKVYGKPKVKLCVSCHGVNGHSLIGGYPSLAGQQVQYLELALKAYKNSDRKGPEALIMTRITSTLSDDDIANLAIHFSQQER